MEVSEGVGVSRRRDSAVERMRMGVLLQKVVGWVERVKLRGIWDGCGRLDGLDEWDGM